MGLRQTGAHQFALTALLSLFLLCMATFAHAQAQDIRVGMKVKIGACKAGAKHFTYIDLYTKTLFKDTIIPVDTATGDGLFESFFTPGEFDGKRLSCSYGNKSYRVACLREFETKNGSTERVMLLYSGKFNELLWVQFDKALEAGEISW